MAEEVATETPQSATVAEGGENMEVEDTKTTSNSDAKRAREEEEESNGTDDGGNKKQKVEVSAEEKRLEDSEKSGPVSLGPKSFETSSDMFNYFYKFSHYWPVNFDVNKYEHMVLLDLLKKGHPEPEKKMGSGIRSFQIRNHPMWKSRCFFIVREDDSVDDFSFRKCIDSILPLPEQMKAHAPANRALGGHGGRGGGHGGRGGGGRRGGGRGRGRGRGSRN